MDLNRARVTLRERALLDVLDLSLRFAATHAGPYARLSLAVLVPGFLASWAATRLGGWWLAWTVALVLAAFASAPYVALASRLVFAERVAVREALSLALRALPSLLGVRLLELLALAASVAMSLLPWIWIGTVLLFVVEVVVLERPGVVAAMGRAQRVATTHFGAVMGAMLLLTTVPVAAALLADVAGREILQSVLEIRPPPSMFRLGGSWLALAGFWGAVPLVATARFFVYLDVRTRSEGWDIQTRFAALASRGEGDGVARRAA